MRALSMIPLPLRLAGLVLIGVLGLKLLGGALGAWMLSLAIILWLITLLTLGYEFGWLNPLARLPGLRRFFGFMTNAAALRAPGAPEEARRASLSDTDRARIFAEAQKQLAALEGIEAVRAEILERLVAPAEEDPEDPFGTRAPALVALFAGPRATGKTTAAIATAQMLTGRGALETANVVTLRATDLRAGQASPADLARAKATQALDGTLLLDDAGWLLGDDGYGGPGPAADFGAGLLEVVSQHPQRLFIVMTLETEEAERLQRAPDVARWLGKLTVRAIRFPDLDDETLLELLQQRLEDQGWALEAEAAPAARRLMAEVRDRAGESFDNADSCRRIAERLAELQRAEADAAALRDKLITRTAVRALDDSLE